MKKVLMRFPLTSKARRVPRAHIAPDHWCAELSPAALHMILQSACDQKTASETTSDNHTKEMTITEIEAFIEQGCPGIPRASCPTCPLLAPKG